MTEKTKQLQAALSEPFDIDLLFWKPQATNKAKTQAIVAVYADPRAYTDRLNEVVGVDGWRENYSTVVVPFQKEVGWNEDKRVISGHKLIVTCYLEIEGLGAHAEVGESDTGDDNVATSAFAQAFKRACVRFGLGRYLYDFPKGVWAPYDKDKRAITTPPPIPDWAVPKVKCHECRSEVQPWSGTINKQEIHMSVSEVLANGKKKYGRNLCAGCQRKLRDATAPEAMKKSPEAA